jgi:hypothetical protein
MLDLRLIATGAGSQDGDGRHGGTSSAANEIFAP